MVGAGACASFWAGSSGARASSSEARAGSFEAVAGFKKFFFFLFYIYDQILLFWAILDLELELHGSKTLAIASAGVWTEFLLELELEPKIPYLQAPATII